MQIVHTIGMNAYPETSLAASYFCLYQGFVEYGEQPALPSSHTSLSVMPGYRRMPTNESSAAFWANDEWTEKDERAAQEILERNLDRCRITAVSPHHKNERSSTSDADSSSENGDAWNRFYSQHRANFFKDRYYLTTAFPEEFGNNNRTNEVYQRNEQQFPCLVEIGCGVGNTMLPLLEDTTTDSSRKKWTVYGFDLSGVAIDLLRQDARFQKAARQGRAFAAVVDISCGEDDLERYVGIATVASLVFCLSAMDPHQQQPRAVRNAVSTLQPGGVLVFRDYGRYDEAQLKLGTQRQKQLGDSFYRKQDGTKCYYFTLSDLEDLFVKEAGMEVLELQYIKRVYTNRSTGAIRRRIWVQARFRKPMFDCSRARPC
jgi:SAM-dependent methyltransferase